MFEVRNPTLTGRQRQVLELAAQGRTVQETAAELGISRDTVNEHREAIRWKLQARTTHEAVARAFHTGVL